MPYCRDCGERILGEDRYCSSCGSRTTPTDHQSIGDTAEQIRELFEGMIDRQIDRIDGDELDVPAPLVDRLAYAYKLYIIGLMKGRIEMLLLSTVDDPEDPELVETDFSPFYEWIADTVEEREDRLREALERPETGAG